MVRLSNTGSECTMHAIRLARGYTGRDLILKFEGCYHGAHDYVLWSTASGNIDEVGETPATSCLQTKFRHPRSHAQPGSAFAPGMT